jgi:hypothetical protein
MADLISGKHTRFTVYFNNQPFVVIVKTWSIEEVATEVADDVNGEERSRLQILTNYYKANFACYDDGSSNYLQNLLQSTQNDDAFNPQIPLNGGLLFNYLSGSGTQAAFAMNAATRGPLKVGSGGRVERVMHDLSMRFQYFNQVPAAG